MQHGKPQSVMLMLMPRPVEIMLDRLYGVEELYGDGYMAFCPSHPDGVKHGKQSLHVREEQNGTVFFKCFASCTKEDILDALGLTWNDLYPEDQQRESRAREQVFEIRDRNGVLVATHHRLNLPNGSKRVWWRGPNGEKKLREIGLSPKDMPLYPSNRIDEFPRNAPVFVTEGEKAAEALLVAGIPAVGTVCGASGIPTQEALAILEDRDVILWPDSDEEGRAHMRQVAEQLVGLASSIRVFDWKEAPSKGDAADYGEDKLKVDFPEILKSAKPFLPTPTREEIAVSFGSFVSQLRTRLENRRLHNGVTGIRTGIKAMDEKMYGINHGMSYLFLAGTNTGKSLFAGQISLTAALADHRTLLYTGEQSPVLYLDRMAHKVAGVSYDKSLRGQITEIEQIAVVRAAERIAKLPLSINSSTGHGIDSIRRMIEMLEPELLVIDHIQRVRAADGSMKRHQQVGEISAELSTIKTEYNIAVAIMAQANRAHGGHRAPELYETRDSGEIENDADCGVILYRPGRENDAYPADLIELKCEKMREGYLWDAKVRFMAEQNWIEDIPPSELQRYESVQSEVAPGLPNIPDYRLDIGA